MKKARIEIIPMIDTIFFLMVFFLITAITQTKMNGIATALPQNSSAVVKSPPPREVVTVDKSGRWSINGMDIEPSQLQPQLQAIINARPTAIIIVNIAKTRRVQEAITVMDAIDGVRLPASAATGGSDSPAVMIATTPIDAHGNPVAPTAASPTSAGTP